MAPIIRKPAVSDEKRALGRRGKAAPAASAQPVPVVPPAKTAVPVLPAATPVVAKPTVPDAVPVKAVSVQDTPEFKQALAQARDAMRRELDCELQQLRDKASEQGHAEGLRRAEADVAKARDEQAAKVAQLLQRIESASQLEQRRVEHLAAAIAFEAICKIAGDTLLTVEGVLAVVRQVLKQVNQRQPITVYLAPADLKLLEGAGTDDAADGLIWRADERVQRGGCIVETAMGELDARLENQLQRIFDAFLSVQRASS
ncbi:Flagellar biosynthesis/type III secretory pathway protein FliH [Andreprevotia lacus DSM 23236]|jgi:flagellar assembly protein FliH|uniref:Flagellar assembly protein FliH n=1 Tax=Andreprevotia lacus DSM 23236 TaxID=1121001 RepID=A0A1W1XUM1_9NEIS|nr:FliH/SctL family protein [Andreprevotia lacus]SMC27680.1 Flagellar biosynthesis/type III secretory pathway protein FliH [Andreprevotia lacus DSM 23236]